VTVNSRQGDAHRARRKFPGEACRRSCGEPNEGVKAVAEEIEVKLATDMKRADDQIAEAALESPAWDENAERGTRQDTSECSREAGGTTPSAAGSSAVIDLPQNVFRYVLKTSGVHQLLLSILAAVVFLIELVPLELQRRIVNDLVKNRGYGLLTILCAVYAGVVIVQGAAKLVLNVYRGWVGERATRDLRRRIQALVGAPLDAAPVPEAQGIQVSMIVSEVEPIGGFVGGSVSEPLLQGGVLLSILAYMIHLDPWMALVAAAIFMPQLVLIPLLQSAIIQRTATRVQILRGLSISVVAPGYRDSGHNLADVARIDHVFELDMGIFQLKFTMNFLMNFCNHLQVIAALLLGGWYVLSDQLVIGGVVAFISAVGRLNDPWGDLVNYFRDLSVTQVRFRLLANAVNQLTQASTMNVAKKINGPAGDSKMDTRL
jgi:ABC-type bacteriocin/lantibiotic exporter with double-glycine peptidase domain